MPLTQRPFEKTADLADGADKKALESTQSAQSAVKTFVSVIPPDANSGPGHAPLRKWGASVAAGPPYSIREDGPAV